MFKSDQFTERRYIDFISNTLDKFKWTGDTAKFRCPFCNDSQKNKSKTRGYLFRAKGTDFYYTFKCHNCGEAMGFPRFLETINRQAWQRYKIDCMGARKLPEKPNDAILIPKIKVQPRSLSVPLSRLPDDHEGFLYIRKRLLPSSAYPKLEYVNSFSEYIYDEFLAGVDHEYNDKENKIPSDKRIVIPFIDRSGERFCVQGRAIGKGIRYVTIRKNKETPKVFGLESNDNKNITFLTEGPLDSLFLPNALAIGGAGINRATIDFIDVSPSNLIAVYDNEPRSPQIVKHIESAIDLGLRVVIWKDIPSHLKDINKMIESGISRKQLLNIISDRCFSGLRASLELKQWKLVE